MKVPKPRLRWWWWVTLIVVVLLGAHAIWTVSWSRRYEARLDALRAAGEHVLLTDFATPPPPAERNAATAFHAAARWYEEHVESGEAVMDHWQIWEEIPVKPDEDETRSEDLAALREWLARGDRYVELLAEAMERPDWHEEHDWAAGPAMEVHSIPRMQSAVQFLEQRVLRAEEYSPQVLAELELLARLARKVELPFVFGLLMTWTVDGVVADTAQGGSKLPGFDAEAAWRILNPLLRLGPDAEPLRRAFQEERAIGIWVTNRLAGGQDISSVIDDFAILPHEQHEPEQVFNWHYRALVYRDGGRYLDLIRDAIDLADEAPLEAAAHAESMGEGMSLGKFNLVSGLFWKLPMRVYGRSRLQRIARMRVARAGLALLVHRKRTGEWPESLEAIASMVGRKELVDPYTGELLIWKPGVRLEAAKPGEDPELFDLDIAWDFTR